MKADDFKRLIANGSQTTRQLNAGIVDTVCTFQPKPMDRETLVETRTCKGMGASNLCGVDIAFAARHGKTLDNDNRNYVGKVIIDALVNMGFSDDDQTIETTVTQR